MMMQLPDKLLFGVTEPTPPWLPLWGSLRGQHSV